MDFRQRLEQSRPQITDNDGPPDTEDHIISPNFATDRGNNPHCLELRLPDGNRKAIPYAYFVEISFDVETGIEILTTQKRITIEGRNLSSLFDALVTYRVRYIQPTMGTDMQEDGLYIDQIHIGEL